MQCKISLEENNREEVIRQLLMDYSVSGSDNNSNKI